jgi:hypothetical protein
MARTKQVKEVPKKKARQLARTEKRKQKKRDKPRKEPKLRAAFARKLMKVPILRRFYLRRLLKHIDDTPREKLEPELRQLQAALATVPPPRRMAMLESALEQGPEATDVVQQSRALRRAAERQNQRARRR